MSLDMNAKMARGGVRLMVFCALVLGSSTACDSRYSHGRIAVDSETRHRWDAGEKEAEEAGNGISPIEPSKSSPEQVPVASLRALLTKVDSSTRHGAGDKRLLSLVDSGRITSANILAEIVLVKGSEYKSEKDFEAGWIPIAIVYRPPPTRGLSDKTYEKLGLSNAPVSWVFVHEVSKSQWIGSLVRPEGDSYAQLPLTVTIADSDHLEPVIGARFVWEDNDESIWSYCGGKCCQIKGGK
jgi:hypothetical protein